MAPLRPELSPAARERQSLRRRLRLFRDDFAAACAFDGTNANENAKIFHQKFSAFSLSPPVWVAFAEIETERMYVSDHEREADA